jgi:hypothetical protein
MPTIYENSELKTGHKMFGITNTHICKYFLNFIHTANEIIPPTNTRLNNTIQITDDTININFLSNILISYHIIIITQVNDSLDKNFYFRKNTRYTSNLTIRSM